MKNQPLALKRGQIYAAVHPSGAIKIGIARNPAVRVDQLGVQLIGAWAGSWLEEQAIHRRLRASRIKRREWYADTLEVAAFIKDRLGVMITTGRVTAAAQVILPEHETLSIRFSEVQRAVIQKAAEARGMTFTAFVRHAAEIIADEPDEPIARGRSAA